MALPFLPGDDNDWENVAKEILMATAALHMCQDGEPAPPQEDEHLRLFQHILTLITTGEFWQEAPKRKKDGDNDAAIFDAVTGRVELSVSYSLPVTMTRTPTPQLAEKQRQDAFGWLGNYAVG